jgi:Na+/H+ antiporter NhaC
MLPSILTFEKAGLLRFLLFGMHFFMLHAATFGQDDRITFQSTRGKVFLVYVLAEGEREIFVNGEQMVFNFINGRAAFETPIDSKGNLMLVSAADSAPRLYHLSRKSENSVRIQHIPLWLSIVPPLVAILLALIFKEVLISLFLGIWSGAFIAGGLRLDSLYYFLVSLFDVVQRYILEALNDSGHLSILVFSMLIGGMVALVSRNGGMAGIVERLSRLAKTPVSAQFTTWLLGIAIFFDDYANTLIVGNTMRPVTDKFRISREKLSYIVDSTAAPIAAIAFITTWIGAELGYIESGVAQIESFDKNLSPYAIFLNSFPYSFYAFFTLIFVLLVIYTRRDFGPMYHAEIRARTTGAVASRAMAPGIGHEPERLEPVEGAPRRWYNAFIPVLLVIAVTIWTLLDTGLHACFMELSEKGLAPTDSNWASTWSGMTQLWSGGDPGFFVKLGKIIGSADSYVALLRAALAGIISALLLTLGGRILNLADSMGAVVTGFKTMLPALLILILAWSLAAVTDQLHTATFLTRALRDSINPYFLPGLIFILAAGISFSTGSSWSTMAILYPIAIPLAWGVGEEAGLSVQASQAVLYNVIAVVISASVLGDHCSPISDTTILSSMASDCPHIDHVRSQMPYAMIVGLVSLVAGTTAAFLGGGLGVCIALIGIGTLFLYLFLRRFGKKVPD